MTTQEQEQFLQVIAHALARQDVKIHALVSALAKTDALSLNHLDDAETTMGNELKARTEAWIRILRQDLRELS